MNKTSDSKTRKSRLDFIKSRDPLAIQNPDPERSYRWLNVNKFKRDGYQDFRGYELDHTNNSKNAVFQELEGSKTAQQKGKDTTTQIGDLVLSSMPKEDAEEIREYYNDKCNKKLEGILSPSSRSSSLSGARPTLEAIGKIDRNYKSVNIKEGE